jgi:hypothetical protein
VSTSTFPFFFQIREQRAHVVSRSFDEWPVQGSTLRPATSSFPKFLPSTAGSFVIANFQKEKWLSGQKFKIKKKKIPKIIFKKN